jgi:hypothetical protein
MFQKKQTADPVKPKIYVPILYTFFLMVSLVRLIHDVYNNEAEGLVSNVLIAVLFFSLSLFSWIIFKKHSTLYQNSLHSEHLK